MISIKNAKKWAKALRSGKYKQTDNHLQKWNSYCCLGVACDLFIPKKAQQLEFGILTGQFPEEQPKAPEWLKKINDDIDDRIQRNFTKLNDIMGYSFDEIADIIELVYIHNRKTKFD